MLNGCASWHRMAAYTMYGGRVKPWVRGNGQDGCREAARGQKIGALSAQAGLRAHA